MTRHDGVLLGAILLMLVAALLFRPAATSQVLPAGPSGQTCAVIWQDGQSLIDMNHADWQVMTALPGIGQTLAQRIVDDRTENGPFQDMQDLMRVRGIGPEKAKALEGIVVFGG